MKNLLISILCLLILIVPWLIYDRYAGTVITYSAELLEKEVIPAIVDNEWEKAEKKYNIIVDKWKRFEKISEYFLDTAAINEADQMIHKTKYHIMMRAPGDASADSSELKHMLTYLHENEMISPGNIL